MSVHCHFDNFLACNAGDPGLGRSLGEGNGYPLQYSGLENPVDHIVHRVAKSRTRLSDFHFIHLILRHRKPQKHFMHLLSQSQNQSFLQGFFLLELTLKADPLGCSSPPSCPCPQPLQWRELEKFFKKRKVNQNSGQYLHSNERVQDFHLTSFVLFIYFMLKILISNNYHNYSFTLFQLFVTSTYLYNVIYQLYSMCICVYIQGKSKYQFKNNDLRSLLWPILYLRYISLGWIQSKTVFQSQAVSNAVQFICFNLLQSFRCYVLPSL